MTGSLEYASHRVLVASIMVHGAISLAQADDMPPPAEPAKSNPIVHVSNVQPGIVNDWLRNQSSSFNAWDFGGQFRARYEHPEYLGPVDFSATGGHSSDNRMLLRTFVHVGYEPMPWLNFYAEGRDSRGYWDEPNANPDLDTMDLHQAFVQIGNPRLFPLIAKIGRQELRYGDERLIGVSDWTNVRRTFDAAKLRYEVEGFTHDSFYTNTRARRGGLAPTAGAGSGINPNFASYVRSEIDLVATYAFKRFASLQAGSGHFFVGDYVKSSLAGIGGTRDATFVYAQFTLNF